MSRSNSIVKTMRGANVTILEPGIRDVAKEVFRHPLKELVTIER